MCEKDESVMFRKEWRIYGYTGKSNVVVQKNHEESEGNGGGSGAVYGSCGNVGFLCLGVW